VLQERDTGDVRLTDDLRAALREWVTVAETVRRSGDAHELDLLRRRGRQLALRVSDALGRPVEFVDPVSGEVESIRVEGTPRPALAPEPPGPIPWGSGSRGGGVLRRARHRRGRRTGRSVRRRVRAALDSGEPAGDGRVRAVAVDGARGAVLAVAGAGRRGGAARGVGRDAAGAAR
jgi:hypothetical protein